MSDEYDTLRIVIDGRDFVMDPVALTGRDILAAVEADPAASDVLIRVDGGRARLLAPTDQVVPADGEAHFRVHRSGTLRYLKVNDRFWEWGAPAIQEHDIRDIAGIPDDVLLHLVGGDPLRSGGLVDLTVDWVPSVVSKPDRARALTVPVVVNGRQQHLAMAEVSFEDLVALAYPDRPPRLNEMFTVTYRHGPADRPEGSLAPTQTMRSTSGASYNVTATDKS
ncbi:MAG: multiubiquitin domain-containing protein [Sphingobium limneticum]